MAMKLWLRVNRPEECFQISNLLQSDLRVHKICRDDGWMDGARGLTKQETVAKLNS